MKSRSRRRTVWTGALLLVPALALILALPGCEEPVPGLYPAAAGDEVEVWIADHGYHAGLVLPVAELRGRLPLALDWLGDARWLEIGWGDEGFYRAASTDVPWSLLPRALLWPTPSVLHLVGFAESPDRYFAASGLLRLRVSRAGLAGMLRVIRRTLDRPEDGSSAVLGDGIYGRSRFFRARPSYHLFRTCNHWTAEVLREGGLPITPFYGFTSGNLVYQLSGDPGVEIIRP